MITRYLVPGTWYWYQVDYGRLHSTRYQVPVPGTELLRSIQFFLNIMNKYSELYININFTHEHPIPPCPWLLRRLPPSWLAFFVSTSSQQWSQVTCIPVSSTRSTYFQPPSAYYQILSPIRFQSTRTTLYLHRINTQRTAAQR